MHASPTPKQPERTHAWHRAVHEKPPPPLLSIRQAAELIGVSTRTLKTMLTEPWAPAPVEVAPRVQRIVRDELLDAIANRAPRRTVREEPAHLALARASASKPAGTSA